MFTVIIAAVLVLAMAVRVSANEVFVLAAGQDFEVALPGTGSHFAPVPQGTFLAAGSKMRTGNTGWATLHLGNETQVELRANSEVAFPSVFRSAESLKTGSNLVDPPPDSSPVSVEMELRRGTLAALTDGATELRVWFANSVTMARHARFAVKAEQGGYARVIMERGTARIFVNGGKKEVSPMAGQSVEINKLATGHTVTTVQPVRSNDAEAVAEMAALRFVPALAEPAAKPPLTIADNSAANQPTAAAPPSSGAAAANGPPVNQPASTATSASLPLAASSSAVQPGAVATASYGAPPLSSLANVDPLQAPANGANIKGPVNSPTHTPLSAPFLSRVSHLGSKNLGGCVKTLGLLGSVSV